MIIRIRSRSETEEEDMMIMTWLALLPAIVLMFFVYQHDKAETEPIGLVCKVFVRGALSAFLAMVLELILGTAFAYLLDPNSLLYSILAVFVGVGMVEEFCKRRVLMKHIWYNPEFNYRFDGIVYGVSSALGFAALENILYVLDTGLGTALVRSVTAVPAHAAFGVLMGYYLGQAKAHEIAGNAYSRGRYLMCSLLIPSIVHGIYDWILMYGSEAMMSGWLVFVIALDVAAIFIVRKASREDYPI